MVWIAKNLEEPIRGLITLVAVVAAWIAIPWITDAEGLVRAHVDTISAASAVFYWVVVIVVVIVCGVIGYYIGKAVTRPLRAIAERHDLQEQERMRALQQQ